MAASATETQIYDYLRGQGLNASAASGVMGNLEVESGFKPNITNGIGAFGLAQWLGSRKTALINYANSRGLSPSSLQAQLGYLWQEISSGSEGVTPASLNAAGSPQAAAALFSNKFERPGNDGSLGKRESDAAQVYNDLSGSTVPQGATDLTGLTQTSAGSSSGGGSGAQAFPTGSDPIQIIDKSLNLTNLGDPSAWLHPVQSVMQDAGAIALRTVLVIIGLILIIFALVAVVEKSGVVPQGVPVE